jgi:hypothetical protein
VPVGTEHVLEDSAAELARESKLLLLPQYAEVKANPPASFDITSFHVKSDIVRTDDLESRRCVIVPIVNSWQPDWTVYQDVSLAALELRHHRVV